MCRRTGSSILAANGNPLAGTEALMKHLFPAALFLLATALPAVAQPTAPAPGQAGESPASPSAVISAQLNAQLREPIVNGDAHAARAALLTQAEKICETLQQALHLACSVNSIQFNAHPIGMVYGAPQGPGDYAFGSVNFLLGPHR
jgi:hypothetical protein